MSSSFVNNKHTCCAKIKDQNTGTWLSKFLIPHTRIFASVMGKYCCIFMSRINSKYRVFRFQVNQVRAVNDGG